MSPKTALRYKSSKTRHASNFHSRLNGFYLFNEDYVRLYCQKFALLHDNI